MSRNFRLEAELKEAAVAAGCLESALADFELDVQAFRLTSASEIPATSNGAKLRSRTASQFSLITTPNLRNGLSSSRTSRIRCACTSS